MNELKPVLTVLGSDPYDERDGLRASPEDLAALKYLPKGTKLYAIPDTHRVVSAATTTKEWADANVIVPPEVKGRVMSEMFWRGVYAAQSAIIDNKEQS